MSKTLRELCELVVSARQVWADRGDPPTGPIHGAFWSAVEDMDDALHYDRTHTNGASAILAALNAEREAGRREAGEIAWSRLRGRVEDAVLARVITEMEKGHD